MISSGPLERTCWKQFAVQWGDCKKSGITPLNAIIVIVIVIVEVGDFAMGLLWQVGCIGNLSEQFRYLIQIFIIYLLF